MQPQMSFLKKKGYYVKMISLDIYYENLFF
jgi:hypothetical protein